MKESISPCSGRKVIVRACCAPPTAAPQAIPALPTLRCRPPPAMCEEEPEGMLLRREAADGGGPMAPYVKGREERGEEGGSVRVVEVGRGERAGRDIRCCCCCCCCCIRKVTGNQTILFIQQDFNIVFLFFFT